MEIEVITVPAQEKGRFLLGKRGLKVTHKMATT